MPSFSLGFSTSRWTSVSAPRPAPYCASSKTAFTCRCGRRGRGRPWSFSFWRRRPPRRPRSPCRRRRSCHVPAERDRTSGTGVGERERPATTCVEVSARGAEGFDADADLDVPQLAMKKCAWAVGPAEEHVAGGLHEPVAVHDALAVVVEDARAGVRLQHRGARLLDLEEEGSPSPA